VLGGDRSRHFGRPEEERLAARDRTVLVDVSHLSLLRARGPDAKTFLNAQLSNDLDLLDEDHSMLAAWCTAAGRVLVVFRVFLQGDGYLLQLPASLREDILARLRRYVLRAKVTLESADADRACLGLSGPEAARLLKDTAGFVPDGVNACRTRNGVTLLALPGPQPRFEIIAPPPATIALWEKLRDHAVVAGSPVWSWLDIMAGLPTVLPQTAEAFVPQTMNLELVGGVSFKKGCYPGQEIVARMQYLGKLKQRLYRAHATPDIVPDPGTPIYASPSSGQAAGQVVEAQPAPGGGCDLLAVLSVDSAKEAELHLGSEQGPRLIVEPLPHVL
jgi:folate-binding protein YgfZ